MIVINKLKPLYIDKENKIIRMGNFKDTGKEICYEDDSLLVIFKNCGNGVSKEDLISKVHDETNISNDDIEMAIEYLLSENFLINEEEYETVLSDKYFNRENLFFSMVSDNFRVISNAFLS